MKIKFYFQKSSRYSCLYHLFTFAFTLACGYAVSLALDAAIERQGSAVYGWAAVLGGLLLIGLPVLYFFARFTKKQKELDAQTYREALYKEIMENRLPVQHTGELDVRLHTDARTVTEYVQDVLPKVLEGGAIILGSALILCSIHALAGGLLLAMGFLQLIPTLVYEKWAKSIYEEGAESEADYEGWLAEGAEGLRTLKSYGRESWFVERYRQLNRRLIQAGKRSERTGTWESIIYEGIHSVLYYGSYLWIGFFILNNTLRVADAPMMIILSGYIYQSMESVFDWVMKRYEYQTANKRLKLRRQRGMSHAPDSICVSLKGVSKGYGEKTVLQDVSFSVKKGERVLLCGSNGSGKTTLLNILAALDRPTEGEVLLNGQNIVRIPERTLAAFRREHLGFVFQDFNLLDTLTLKDNIFLPLVLSGKKYTEMESRIAPIAEQLGISKLLNKYPYEVSGGQKQRAAIARALITQPQLILADEPSGALDSRSTDELLGLFNAINDNGQTIVMVTHSVKAASTAKRVLFIKDGEVFHQLYRGNLTSDEMYQKITDTLTVLTTGGEHRE